MRRLRIILAAACCVLLAAGIAGAKPKAAKGVSVTEREIRICLGGEDSTAEQQIPVCTKIINSGKVKYPYESDYYAARGAAYFALKQQDKAVADLNTALSIRQVPAIYFQRALIHMARRDSDAAIADLAQVMKLKPDYAPAFFMRGLVSYRASEYSEAVTYFDGAVKRLPTYYQALFARGVAKRNAGDESGGDTDIKDARGMSSHVEADMEKLGLKP